VSQLSDIRNAVADRIRASGIDSTVNVFAYPPTDPALPAVLLWPAGDTYVEYHNTLGPVRVQTAHFIAQVVVPLGGSAQSAQEFLDELLSSGTGETVSIADAITGNDLTIGTGVGYMLAGDAENWRMGEMTRVQTTPVVAADIPVTVGLNRS
jgi:hypothetical protein